MDLFGALKVAGDLGLVGDGSQGVGKEALPLGGLFFEAVMNLFALAPRPSSRALSVSARLSFFTLSA